MPESSEIEDEHNDLVRFFEFLLAPNESREKIRQYIYEIYSKSPTSYPPNVLRNNFIAAYFIYKNCIEDDIDIGIDMQMSEFETLLCSTFYIIEEIENEEMRKYGLYMPTIQNAVRTAKESLRVMEEGDKKKIKRNYQKYVNSFRALSKLYFQLLKGRDIGYFLNHPTIVEIADVCDNIDELIQNPVNMTLAKTGRCLLPRNREIGYGTMNVLKKEFDKRFLS